MPRTQSQIEEFKDSLIGRIPKDWDVKPLSEVADVDRGKFTHRPRNDPRFYGGMYPFIQTGDIAKASGTVITTYSQTLNERGIGISREFPVGTIAITIAANIADTAILDIPMFFPDSVVGAVVKEPNSIRYVEWCIHCAKQLLDARAPQSAQKNINLEDLRPLLIPAPLPEEQHKIAEVIDTIDSTIAHTSTLIAKLKQMKAGLLHDLLTRGLDKNGELRDAIEHPEQFKDSPLGQIPKDWDIGIFEKLADAIDPQPDHRAPPEVQDGKPYVGVGDFRPDGSIDFDSCRKVSSAALAKQQQRFRIELGDIIFGKIGTIGLPKFLPQEPEYALNVNTVLIKPRICPSYVMSLLNSKIVDRQIQLQTHSTSQPAFGIQRIRAMLAPIPSESEQFQITAVLDAHEVRIKAEEVYLNKLKEQKKGLMHDLLTGRVRVTDLKEIPA